MLKVKQTTATMGTTDEKPLEIQKESLNTRLLDFFTENKTRALRTQRV